MVFVDRKWHYVAAYLWRLHRVFKVREVSEVVAISCLCVATLDFLDSLKSKY